jgi:hypothetical protein
MQVYCGIPTTQQSFLGVARSLESPLLVSANAFWKDDRFYGYEVLWDIEVPLVLDSGGFVAMRKFGGYRWSVQEYINLAVMLRPLWWASQDFACEPELAADPAYYVLGDGGRMESDAHYEERNDCGVRSLVFLTGYRDRLNAFGKPTRTVRCRGESGLSVTRFWVTYDEAWEMAERAGRQPYCGFDALPPLLEEMRKVGVQISQGSSLKYEKVTTVSFAKSHPTGNYFLLCKGHVLACKDGLLYDTSSYAATMAVLEYWEIPALQEILLSLSSAASLFQPIFLIDRALLSVMR